MDRIFQKTDIEEICTAAKQAITDTKDCIDDIKSTARAISAAAGNIPAEAKSGDLAGVSSALPGKLEKDNYDTTKTKLDQCREKACTVIPAFDTQYAGQMQTITEETGKIKKVIEELQEFMLETPLTTPSKDFEALLKAKETKWKKTLDGVEATLDEVLANTKGCETISTVFSKDPVNLSTGNFIYDKTDLEIKGTTPFAFRRFYNSRNRYEGALGTDWNHNYELSLTFQKSDIPGEDEVTILLEDGKEETFLPVEGNRYTPGNQSLAVLEKTEKGYTYTTLSGEKNIFDREGTYLRHEDNNGQGYELTYETIPARTEKTAETTETTETETPAPFRKGNRTKRLTGIRKDTGETFTLTYDEEGHLKTVTDHTGRTVSYEIRDRHLIKAVRPDGGTLTYSYDGNGKLTSVTNPRGIITVENEYDENHRTTRQNFPDGTNMSYEYDDENHTVTLTERNGSKTIHIHDDQYRNIKNIYPDGEESFTYNSRNQKTKITDKLGNETRLSYDNRGNLTGITNPLGTKLTITYETHNKPTNVKIDGKEKQKNTYDKKGNLLETRDALQRKTIFTYNETGLPETITQPDGSTLKITYDEKGNIRELTDAAGEKTTYTYDALNRVIKMTDPKGNTLTLTYDSAGNIHTLKNAAGDQRTYEYNQSNKVTKITDFDGSTIQRTYNALNKPETITDQQGRKTNLTYDAMWNLARITMPDGTKTTCLYNENNRLSRIKDPAGNVTRYTYDGNGNCIKKEDPTGETTRFTYDAIGRLIHAEGPEGSAMTYTYDREGHVTEAKDSLGNTVTMEYDEAGQLIKETNPLGYSRTYTYTPLGKIKSVTDEAGRTTAYAYLPGGRLSEVTYSDGTKETYTYDPNGNIKIHTTRENHTLTYTYDSLDRIIKTEGSGGEKKQYTYDAVGNVTAMTDAGGNTTRYEYSLTGQLTKVTDALGNETEYTYDLCDRLTEIRQYGEKTEPTPGIDRDLLKAQTGNRKNRTCHVTRYQRNTLGQVETITDALGQTEHYTYDAKGQLLLKLDKEGYLTKYGYTGCGDLNHIQYADGKEVRLSYNPLRQLEEMKDWLGTTKIQNDPLGRAVKVQYPDGKEVSYTYGKTGERTSITYPDGKTILYTYDEQIRLVGLKDGKDTVTYSYDDMGRLTQKTFPGGCRTDYAYDPQGHLAGLTHSDTEGILDHYAYRYDRMGNKTAIEKQRRGLPEESGLYTYGYDPLGRLSEVTKDGNLLRTYGYDAYGNRTRMTEGEHETTYTYNAMNQLMSRVDAMNEETYAYDRRGNLSLVMENGTMKNSYTYGALNRLEQAVNGKGEAAAYEYNGLGHRTGKTITPAAEPTPPDPLGRQNQLPPDPETKIRYTIDLTKGYHNLLQKEETGSRQTYLWDGNVAGMKEEGREENGLTARSNQPGTCYYFQDELGSPVRLINEEGSLRETYGYDEFGQDLYGNQGEIQPFGYTGYQSDRIAGTYYAQAREYRAELGRFASKDQNKYYKIINPITWNLYVYCGNNTLNFIDPEGKDSREAIDTLEDYAKGDWDTYGIEIGLHWLFGGGEDINIYSDSSVIGKKDGWQSYMENNAILTGKVGDVVIPIGNALENGETMEIDMNMSMIIDNGEGAVGYQFLHGTNADAGDFQINGTISKDSHGNTTYDLTYTWNDIIDPNYIYTSDQEKADAAHSIWLANPTDYNLHISWHDVTVIKNETSFFSRNRGWLKNYSNDWIDQLSDEDKLMLQAINYEQIELGGLTWEEQMKQILGIYSYYYNCGGVD